MLENAEKVREQFSALIDKAESASELETLKIEYLGKKGRVAALMSDLKNVAADRKKEAGRVINDAKQYIEGRLREKAAPNRMTNRSRPTFRSAHIIR